MIFFPPQFATLLAASEITDTGTSWEFAREDAQIFVIGFVALLLLVGWFYRRDTSELNWFWKGWLFSLRALVLVALLVIALDPQERVETRMTRPSQVAILVDKSVSMDFPEETPNSTGQAAKAAVPSRANAVERLLAESSLLPTLRDTHNVRVYSFDSTLKQQASLPRNVVATTAAATAPPAPTIPGTDWETPGVTTILIVGGGLTLLTAIAAALLAWLNYPAVGAVVLASFLGVATAISAVWSHDTHTAYLAELQAFNEAQAEKQNTASADAAADTAATEKPDWAKIVEPNGLETRLGESLVQLIREVSSETLSGIVVISDGGNNAGIDPSTAREAALAAKVRLLTVGVGSTERPINLQLANVQAPTHVHMGDGFSLTAFVQGQGLAGRTVEVELLSKLEQDEGELAVVDTQEVTLLEDGTPASVTFNYMPTEAGRRIFNIRARPTVEVAELSLEDNERALPPVEIVERKLKVLIIAGGPLREYQFVRNLLHRDESTELHVWLQTGLVGTSQESDTLLFKFPETKEELFQYDVILAFDPDWKQISAEGIGMLSEWVFQQAGGLILVAGDIYTQELASASDDLRLVQSLYPVALNASLFDYEFRNDEFQQPWPIEFTRDGREAEFLQLTDEAGLSASAWKDFPGVLRAYPSGAPKAGATVYAYFSDPRSVTEHGKPILIASQFYGAGRTLYFGSAEMWRLRALEESFYERLWVKAVREVGQGRLLRGTNRGVLLLERSTYPLGSTIQVRANLLDPQFRELVASQVTLEVYDPSGRPLVPGVALIGNPSRPGQFQGAFSANLPGRYRLELPIPESQEQAVGYIQVELPNLEYERPEQNDGLLRRLATTEFGGEYLTLAEAATALPAKLPDRSTTKTHFDVPRTLWDQAWVMYLLVALLSLEWLTRKLLKLA